MNSEQRTQQLAALRSFNADRPLAHAVLFRHRHPQPSAAAHRDLIETIHSSQPRVAVEGFRGFGKSTYLEEAAVLRGAFGEFHNLLVVASSWRRGCDRLAPIKAEFEVNRYVIETFGQLTGEVWQEGKIVLSNGVCIQVVGREQSMLGIKHMDWRPDAALVDDVEDPDELRSDVERAQTWEWFMKTFLPSLDDPTRSWVRVLGTRRGAGSLMERLEKEGWPSKKYPIEYVGDDGKRQATWPGKFGLAKIDEMRRAYRNDVGTWMQEYMCQPASEAARIFNPASARLEARAKSWETTLAMIDPARTVSRGAATTGWAAFSWIGNRIVVWEADGRRLLPDEIVSLGFDLCERLDPVWLGIERDGLEQWLLQPFRQEMARRGTLLPLKGVGAVSGTRGGGQGAFISALQPYFAAGEVIFAQEFPALRAEMASFPYGPRDVLNALAYALPLRPGMPVYEDFAAADHVVEEPLWVRDRPLFVAASATPTLAAAVLCQVHDGKLIVLADWLLEAAPEAATERLAMEMAAWRSQVRSQGPGPADPGSWSPVPVVWVVPRRHAEKWSNLGLAQSVRRLPSELRFGGEETRGQTWLKERLRRRRRGMPEVELSSQARWTLRALAGGYAYSVRRGRLADEVEEGPYRLTMEAIEAFCGMLDLGLADKGEEEEKDNWATDRWGRRYKSAMPARDRG